MKGPETFFFQVWHFDFFLLELLPKEYECASLLPSSHQLNEGTPIPSIKFKVLFYLITVSSSVDPLVFFPGDEDSLELRASFPLALGEWGSCLRTFEMRGTLSLVKQLGTQNNIQTGPLVMYMILVSTTFSRSTLSPKYFPKLN